MDESIPSTTNDAELSPDAQRSQQWKKPSESLFLVEQLARQGLRPRHILTTLYPQYCANIADNIPDEWIMQLLRELCDQRTRQKLADHNTFRDAVELFRKSKRILVITGAGVSVSCGIPDFRSENGVYARLKKDFPELPTPTAMFDIGFFRHNPKPFYNFAREIFPGQFRPSLSHMFIKFLEDENKLLRNYTQNIDTLERIAGITNLVECHGSFARATCLDCNYQVDAEQIRDDVMAQRVADCPRCVMGVLKPDIVFFGEDLGDTFHAQMGADHTQLDLLVVIGSSMEVRPVGLIPFNIAADVPQILVNRQLLRNYAADIKLLGTSDSILVQIALAMGGKMRQKMLNELQLRRDVLRPMELPSDLLTRVDQLLTNHAADNDGGTKTVQEEQEVFPRQVSVDEFKQYIFTKDNSNGVLEEEGEETARKKCKLVVVEEETAPEGLAQQKLEQYKDTVVQQQRKQCCIWQSNYALIDAHLPSADTLLFVPPNLNVFVGAELYYDRDQDTFVHRTGIKERKWTGHVDDDDDNDEHEHDEPNSGDDYHEDDDGHGSSSSACSTTTATSSSSSSNTSCSTRTRRRNRDRDNMSLPAAALGAADDVQHHRDLDKSSQRFERRKADSCPPAFPSTADKKWSKKN